ncbi:response regulator [Paenibacillus sp. HJL G12]|uniref:Response regulator n=1 Tax=Paenibacillus dendrobii TaxID=2691084 RepID=A0A7X3LI64_9BACL|nr:response regulator [Paenibacillus dendrobii]MWV43969.1 response regulator [Paenibacillus dendrobii]
MYKVMIVDDEMLARVGIKSLIPWEENGFVVVKEAENGKKAYEWIMENSVDIVITDIKMPVMNGIELISQVGERKPDVKFLVLSSFDDFEYVREALKSGAEDYFIKLQMNPEQLLGQLAKVAEKLESEREQKQQTSQTGTVRSQELALVREKLLKDLIYGWIHSESEYRRRMKEAELEFPDGQVVSIVFQTGGMEIYERYRDDEIHLLNYAIVNILNEMTHDQQAYPVSVHPKEFVILSYCRPGLDYAMSLEQAGHLADSIKAALKQYLNFTVSMAISEPVPSLLEAKQSYRQAMEALGLSYAFPGGSTIYYREIKTLGGSTEAADIAKEMRKLEHFLNRYEDNQVYRTLGSIRQLLMNLHGHSLDTFKMYSAPVAYLLSSSRGGDDSGWMDQQLKQMDKWTVKSDVIQWLEQVQEEWMDGMSEDTDSSRLILSAKRYIRKNYASSLTLEAVAEYLQLSPSYFSNLFKKETGQNFIDYATNLRIEQSKILLRTTEMKVYEIGRTVGYENEHYFSRVFKKVVGCSPLHYKSDNTL